MNSTRTFSPLAILIRVKGPASVYPLFELRTVQIIRLIILLSLKVQSHEILASSISSNIVTTSFPRAPVSHLHTKCFRLHSNLELAEEFKFEIDLAVPVTSPE
jgi:hypothetical protein